MKRIEFDPTPDLVKGAKQVYKVVAPTFGPQGRTVMLQRPKGILSTADGAHVAWEVRPQNRVQRLGARILQEACGKISAEYGDGTTTTALLTVALAEALLKEKESRPQLINSLRAIQTENLPLEDFSMETLFEFACRVSKEDKGIARGVLEAIDLTGAEGQVVIEKGRGRGIEVLSKSGMEVDARCVSLDLLSGEGTREFESPLVALVDGPLRRLSDVREIIEGATQFPFPLVIVCRQCFGEALKTIVLNNQKLERASGTKMDLGCIRLSVREDLFRDHLEDLEVLTGATIIDWERGISFDTRFFGSVRSAKIEKDKTTFVAFEDRYEHIERRVAILGKQGGESSHSFDIEELQTRKAKLSGGLCVLRVGGITESEIRERVSRVEDVLRAVQSALRGLTLGGAQAFCRLGEQVQNSSLREAFTVPFRQLCTNAGLEVVPDLAGTSDFEGFDVLQKRFRDFRTTPQILEPLQQVRRIVEVAISTAIMLSSAEVAITKGF